MARWQVIVFACAALASRAAEAHPTGGPAVALPVTPDGVGGDNVVSDSFELLWTDSDLPLRTGTATVDLFYTSNMAPTFRIGEVPPVLDGQPAATGIKEADPTNSYLWDVSAVPSGSYFIHTKVTEPQGEMSIFNIIAFSEGVITVWHPPDPIYPAVLFRTPQHAFVTVDESIDVLVEAFDPDGTGSIRLEAFNLDEPETLVLIEEALPAAETSTVPFDTSELADGSWGLKATLTDGRGLSFTAYSRFPFDIVHIYEPPDAGTGPADIPAASSDSGAQPVLDAGTKKMEEPMEGGCDCSAQRTNHQPAGLWLMLLLCLGTLARNARAGRRADRSRFDSPVS